MNACDELRGYLGAYADGELEGELLEKVARHLDACDGCRKDCEDLKKVVELFREAPVPEVNAADWQRVSAALEACMEASSGGETVPMEVVRERVERRWWLRWQWLMPAAGAVAAAVVVAVIMLAPDTSKPDTSLSTQVVSVEWGDAYEASIRPAMGENDFLSIDVYAVK